MAAITPISACNRRENRMRGWLDAGWIAAVALFAGGCAWFLWAHSEWFHDPAQVKAEITSFGAWGPLVFMLVYAVGPSFFVPGAVMTMAGGLAFGALWGAVYSLIGADIGAVLAFGAGRFLGRSFVERLAGERFRGAHEKVAAHGFRIIFYLRMVPVVPYNALNLLAGASPIGFSDYLWASAIGMVPGTILFAFLGDALWHPLSLRFFLAILLIGASVTCGEAWRRSRSRMDAKPTAKAA